MIDVNRDVICVNGTPAEIYRVRSNQPFLYLGAVKLEDEQWYPCSWDIHGKPSKLDPGLKIFNKPRKETYHIQVLRHQENGQVVARATKEFTPPGPLHTEVYYKTVEVVV